MSTSHTYISKKTAPAHQDRYQESETRRQEKRACRLHLIDLVNEYSPNTINGTLGECKWVYRYVNELVNP